MPKKTPKNSKNSIGIPHTPGPLVFPRVPLCFPAPLFVPLSSSSKAVS